MRFRRPPRACIVVRPMTPSLPASSRYPRPPRRRRRAGRRAGRLQRRRRPARLRRRLSQACGLSDSRHRRFQISGDDRLERGGEQRRQLRLDQGDRGRRPSRRALPGQLGGRQAGRHSARRLSLRLLVPPADRGSRPGSSRTCRSRTTRCPRCSTSSRRRIENLPSPSRTATDHRRHEGDARRDGAPFRQAADHLHLGRLLRGDPLRRRLRGLFDLGALDQAPPRRALRLARVEILAIPGRRRNPRHRRRTSTATRSTARANNGRRSSTARSARDRNLQIRPPAP